MKTRLCALGLWLMAFTSQASAQDLMIRDVFKQMPDSLMPYLSQNNREESFRWDKRDAGTLQRQPLNPHEQFAAHRPLSDAALYPCRLCQ